MTATTQSAKRRRPMPRRKEGDGSFLLVSLDRLQPNPAQPRRVLDDTKDEEGRTSLERLAQSIREEGILQPLLITAAPGKAGKFTVVCGERRLKAAKLCGLREVPCVVKEGLSGTAILEMALTENLQRESLTPIDEARAIQTLVAQCGYTQRQIAKRLGLSDAAVNYKLSLLKLSPDLQKDMARGNLTSTQGRAISQEVSRIQGPGAPEKRAKAMQTVHKDLAHADCKLDTRKTRTLAREAVQKVDGNGSPKPKAAAPTKTEKDRAEAFLAALKAVQKALQPFEEAVKDKAGLERFVQVLLKTHTRPDVLIERSAQVLQRVHAIVRQKATVPGR